MIEHRVVFDEAHYNFTDNSARKCRSCGGLEFREIIKDSIEHIVSEYEVRCKSCTTLVSYWAYGYYDPEFAMLEEEICFTLELDQEKPHHTS